MGGNLSHIARFPDRPPVELSGIAGRETDDLPRDRPPTTYSGHCSGFKPPSFASGPVHSGSSLVARR